MNQIDLSTRIQKLIQKKISGVSLAVIEDKNSFCYFEGLLGNIPPFEKKLLSHNYVYDIASLTKVIGTTTRILQLIDEKKLLFQTQICEILPDYFFETATIEKLLLHCSGLPADLQNKEKITTEKIKSFLLENSQSKSKEMIYSDLGFYLLGEVIRQVDQSSLEQTYKKNIFYPMEMYRTSYHVKNKATAVPTEVTETRGVIQGDVHDSKAFQLNQNIGSAGLFSSLDDLVKFSNCFLTNKFPSGKSLFSKRVFALIQKTNFNGRTYGWEIRKNYLQEQFLYHSGFTGTSLGLNIPKKRALIILTNRIHPNREDKGFIKERDELYHKYL